MIKIEIATAIKDTLKQGYNFLKFKSDFAAGFIISLISLPLAMAFAVAVGLPAQHGIYTAIVAGFVTSMLGGAKYQISGPAGAFVVILAPIVEKYGIPALILAQTLAGILILILAVTRTGSLVKFIPYPVVVGFSSGIAVVLLVISLKDMLGINVKLSGHLIDKISILISHLYSIDFYDIFISICTIIIIKKSRNYKFAYLDKIPSYITAILFAIFTTIILKKLNISIKTVSDFSSNLVGNQPANDSFVDIMSVYFNINTIMGVVPAALTIGILAALESLLAAKMADNMTQTKHNPHSELMAIGTANLLSAFIVGMPATGALSRTAANIRLGATSPFAGMICSILIAIYIAIFSDILKFIPLSCLSALLFTVALNMLHINEIKQINRSKNNLDIAILFTTMILTAILDMVAGVISGMMICFLAKIFDIAKLTKIEIENLDNSKYVRIQGMIFFANSSRIFDNLIRFIKSHSKSNIVIDLTNSKIQDTTAFIELINLQKTIQNENVTIKLTKDDEQNLINFTGNKQS